MLNRSDKGGGFASGAALTGIVCLTAIGGVIFAFLKNATPYVTVSKAKTSTSDNLHVAGDLVKSTVHHDLAHHTMIFDIKDATGMLTVVYSGTPPQNMDEATKVVAEGSMKDGKLISDKLLIKCPSKYESEKKS